MNQYVQKFLIVASKRNDLLLAALMISVIFMIVLPLPTSIIDILIAFNLTMAGILLMMAIYLSTPLDFSTFPSVLLVTTLYRLALSISSTRLILLQADAGEIISTFGNFVVSGNIIVGMVVFLIITIVQFVVITRGAERVAEVSARFSLDAMPGKQMSIDGDLRAGVIDANEARQKRSNVEKESQLYGSMDGAMKFVKGDAIAGIIIIAVNIIGGVTIGVLQRGLDVNEALHTYSVLTIGDGLVSQIPGLFIAITAGIIVTRVSGDKGINLGEDIGSQISAKPQVIMITSLITLCFALIPGMPTLIFLIISVFMATLGFIIYRGHNIKPLDIDKTTELMQSGFVDKKPQPSQISQAENTEDRVTNVSQDLLPFSITVPLIMDSAMNVRNYIQTNMLNDGLVQLRNALYNDLGIPFPGIHLRFNENITDDNYQILIQEVPISRGQLRTDNFLVLENKDNLATLGIIGQAGPMFLTKYTDCTWVGKNYINDLERLNIDYLDIIHVITYHLSLVLKRYASEFIGLQEVRFFLDNLEQTMPELSREVQRTLSTQQIMEVLRRLVSEQISIKNLKLIFEILIDWGQREKDEVLLTEHVRSELKRQISYQYVADRNILPVYLLSTKMEDEVRNAIRHSASGSYLVLDPAVSNKFIVNVRNIIGDDLLSHYHNRQVVVLTSTDIRRYIRKILEYDFYELPVLSYQELTTEVTIQPLGKIDI